MALPIVTIHTGADAGNSAFIRSACGGNEGYYNMDNIEPMELR